MRPGTHRMTLTNVERKIPPPVLLLLKLGHHLCKFLSPPLYSDFYLSTPLFALWDKQYVHVVCEITWGMWSWYVNVVCEIYTSLRYIFRAIIYLGWSHIQMEYKFQTNTYVFPMDTFPTAYWKFSYWDRTLTNGRVKLRAKWGNGTKMAKKGVEPMIL